MMDFSHPIMATNIFFTRFQHQFYIASRENALDLVDGQMEKLTLLVLILASAFTLVNALFFGALEEKSKNAGPDPWTDVPCDFDSFSTCGWDNLYLTPQTFNWQLGDGKDSHRKRRRQKTGVKDDRSGGGGYMYIWSAGYKNRTAKLATDFFEQNKPGCLGFWYHMRGRHMGHLKLYELETQWSNNATTGESENVHLLWSVYGNQGQWWQHGVVRIKETENTKRKRLLFEAFDWDAGVAGNIVLDDITYVPSNKSSDCTFAPPQAAPPRPETTTKKTITTVPDITTSLTAARLTTVMESTTSTPTTPKPERHQTELAYPSEVSDTILISSTAYESTKRDLTTSIREYETTQVIAEESPSTEVKTSNAIPCTTKVTDLEQTPPSQNGISVKPKNTRAKIYVAICVVVGLLLLAVALVCFIRYRRRRRFDYYDNCTVHMTRMSPDGIDLSDTAMHYSKLT